MMTFTLPWAALAQDNHRLTTNRKTGRTFTTKRYRDAKETAETLLRAQDRFQSDRTDPVKVEVRVYFPDARRRDVGNLRKCLTDAMQNAGIVADDCLIHDERWIRAGIDRTRPRAEITVAPLPTGATLPLTPQGDPR